MRRGGRDGRIQALEANVAALRAESAALVAAAGDGFSTWRQLAVSPLAHGLVAVRIFVPFGNFTADELEAFAAAMEPFNATRFEVLPSLDLGVVVPEAQLPGLYATLLGLGRDYVARSFVGNLRTCIGCAVCKGGATDAQEVGRLTGEYFDARYRPLDTAEKLAVARARSTSPARNSAAGPSRRANSPTRPRRAGRHPS